MSSKNYNNHKNNAELMKNDKFVKGS